jgi:glycosyltransferase involved in cell wall biosynthesis
VRPSARTGRSAPPRSSVTVNALALRPAGAGVSTYIRELTRAMAESGVQMRAIVQRDATAELPPGTRTVRMPVCSGVRRAALSAVFRSRGLLHGLDVDLPWAHRGPMISTVHDLGVFDVPWAYSAARLRGERALLRHAAKVADVMIADSHFTAERLRAVLRRESVVIPLATPAGFAPATPEQVAAVRRSYALPELFVLHVGTVEPRKDVGRLADACQAAGVPLVLAGGSLGQGMQHRPGVRRLGFIPRQDLPSLFGAAGAVAYCSVYEGFGLPPLEALACGANLVCSRVADLPELLGDAAIWTRPGDRQSLEDGVREALNDQDRRAAAQAAATTALAKLSWASTARAVNDVYESLT